MRFIDNISKKTSKVGKLTKGNTKDMESFIAPSEPIISDYNYTDVLMMNDGVNICAKACAVCWDTKLPDSYEKRSEYIGKRTKIGHTSVIEHSNLVLYMEINTTECGIDLIEFLSNTRFLHTVFKKSKSNKNLGYLIIGGSWRAFADLYKVAMDLSNPILRRITSKIYRYIPSDGMRDIIEAGILDKGEFADINMSSEAAQFNLYEGKTFAINEDIDCINCDDIDTLIKNINIQCPEPELFTIYEMLQFCTITINFKHMSRVITQQLTRHRNGITQESQRYVNYSKGSFNSPAKFHPELYDANHKYTITFAGTTKQLTLQELGDSIAAIYGQLTDKSPTKAKYALKMEDARGYLPNNIQCGTIYITFTWQNFLSFLYLREDPHAQAEIRGYGLELGRWFRSIYSKYGNAIESVKPFNVMDEDSPFRERINYVVKMGDEEVSTNIKEYEELIAAHLENYYEGGEDLIEEEPGDTVLKHGEM